MSVRLVSALVLLGLLPNLAQGQMIEEPAVSEIEALGEAFVHLVNFHEDVDRFSQTFSASTLDAGSAPQLRRAMDFMHAEFTPLEFHHAELIQWEARSGIKMILHAYARDTRNQVWKDFQLKIDDGPNYRISGIGFVADVAEPVFLPMSGLADQFTLDWLDDYVDRLAEDEDLFGSVLIVDQGQVLLEKQVGFEDAGRRIAITADTRFNMASGGKMFTGIALAQLVEQGVLTWQTPVNRWVHGFSNDILLHHLLTHTSGISEYWTDANETRMAASTDPQHDFLELILEAGTDFPPGTGSGYSHSNFVVAGLVVEAASGRDYADYIREEVLEPAGMTATLVSDTDDFSSRVAAPLTGSRRAWEEVSFTPRPTSAGGAYTTARDMVKFSEALANGTLISPETLRTMTTSKMGGVPDATNDFGYGFILQTMEQTGFVGHGGVGPGANFGFEMVQKRELTFVVLSNQDNGAFDDLRRNVMKLISGLR